MAEVKKKKYPISPTMRWISQEAGQEGRLTGEGFRLMKAIAELVEAVTITDGEVTTEMLEAQIIRVSTLFADEVVITSKVAPNAISDITVGVQVGSGSPDGSVIVSVSVPVTAANTTGVILTFTAVQGLPAPGSGNFGSYAIVLARNGTVIDSTGSIYYDDNFAITMSAQFVDASPGSNPVYSIIVMTQAGPGNFSIYGGILNGALFKR